ncbi:MATE family efflux transporter [Facklamia hominis]|uniref:Probable multidrug resistance protein NorM n=1 Tax=Facklamia hominis TaxID=178214 RepID=A0AAJ1V2P4_9LACT|nr:MATE family efflux transporter [Facklamia hominis]MDK7186571.1 MATE family efflux transporter [Facklamia hominis]
MSKQAVSRKEWMTQGPIMPMLLTLSAPLMFNNLVRTFYTVADGLYLAQLSAEDFAASSFSWPLNNLFISIGMGIGVAATALIAHFIGSNQLKKIQVYLDSTLFLTLVLGAMLTVLGIASSEWLLKAMGGQGSFLQKSDLYLKISFLGLFFDFGFFAYQSILNAQGMTKTLTIISAISMGVNLLLDPFFIYDQVPVLHWSGLGWGIAGAAWATFISKWVLLALAAWIVAKQSAIKPSRKWFRWDLGSQGHILRMALPSALGYGGSSLGFTVMNALITSYGTNTLAAFSMINRVSDIVMQPQMGVGMALTPIIGQNMGAKQFDRAHLIFKRAIQFILGMSILASACILLGQEPILRLFIKADAPRDLWNQAREYLYYSAFIIFFMGLFNALNGFFQGCGQTKYSMFMTMGRLWLIRVPIVFLLGRLTDLGSTGIWISMLISNMGIVVWGFYIYRRNNWELMSQMA